MSTEQELSAAVDRLRQCRGGNKQTLCEVYQTPNVFDAQEQHAEDESLVACAYLALGERQPDAIAIKSQRSNRTYEADDIEHAKTILNLIGSEAKLIRVTTFIREIEP